MDPIIKTYLKKEELPKKEDSPYDHMDDVNTTIISSHGDREQKEDSEIERLKHKIEESYTAPHEPHFYGALENAKHNGRDPQDEVIYRAAELQNRLEQISHPRSKGWEVHSFYEATGAHGIANRLANKYIEPIADLKAGEHEHLNGKRFDLTSDHVNMIKAESDNINRVLDNHKLEPHHIDHIKNIIESHPINSPVRSVLDTKYNWFMEHHADSVRESGDHKDLLLDKNHLKAALDKGLKPVTGRILSDRSMNRHHLNKDGSLTRISNRSVGVWETVPYRNTHPIISKDDEELSDKTAGSLYEKMGNEFAPKHRRKYNLEKYTDDSREVNLFTAMKNMGHEAHVKNTLTDEQKDRVLDLPEKISEELKHNVPHESFTVHHGVTNGVDPSHDYKEHELVPITEKENYPYNSSSHEKRTILMNHVKKHLGEDANILGIMHTDLNGGNKFEATYEDKKDNTVKKQAFELRKKPGYVKPEKYIGHLPAFTSTSLTMHVAEDFAKIRHDPDLGHTVKDVISLKIPENYKHGAYLEPITRNREEHEYLLDQNHLIKYNSEPKYYMKDRNVIRHWDGEVIPKKD